MTKLSPITMWAIVIAAFCIVAVGAVAVSGAFSTTADDTGVGAMLQKPFDDKEDVGNSVQTFLIAMVGALLIGLLMGGILRWILKKEVRIAVRVIVSFCVFLVLSVTLAAIGSTLLGPAAIRGLPGILVLLMAAGITALQYFYPEYWVIDVVSILTAVGISALIGSSLGILPVIILLVLFSIYDFIAVLCSGWMKSMAQGSADLKLPSMFILPYDTTTSYRTGTINMSEGKKSFLILGTGDFIFPTVLVVSAALNIKEPIVTYGIVVGILLAYTVMYAMLKYYPEKIRLLPGLPFLCGGAVLFMFLTSISMGVSFL